MIHFTQPGGTAIELWGQGDEFHAVFETRDGYTAAFDPVLKAYCYARATVDGRDLESTRRVVGGSEAQSWAERTLPKHLRVAPELDAQRVQDQVQRWNESLRMGQRWSNLQAARVRPIPRADISAQLAPPATPSLGKKVGLTLLVDFEDEPATVQSAEIERFLNGDNYTGFGNNGSVKQYFRDVSNGLLTYSNVVVGYVRIPNSVHHRSWYADPAFPCARQAQLLIQDALSLLQAMPNYSTTILPTFEALTTDQAAGSPQVVAFNVFYTGSDGGVWSQGLWPHAGEAPPIALSPGGEIIGPYQISNIGSLSLSTFCHETGHLLCAFPDLYDYGFDSWGGAGYFCLMGYSACEQNPVQFCAYLKYIAGWATVTELTDSSALEASVTSAPGPNFNHFYRFQKRGIPTEYFLIENRERAGHDACLPAPGGCAIWHIDELGQNGNQSLVTNSTHANFQVTLVQADNLWELQRHLSLGNENDLYFAGNSATEYQNRFDDASAPNGAWWDGTRSGLVLSQFSTPDANMTFRIDNSPQPILPETHYVRPDGSNPYPPYVSWETAANNIQDAIDVAQPGDTVLLDGIFVLAAPVRVHLAIELKGLGAALTFLDGNGATNCVEITDPGAVVRDLTIRNGGGRAGGAAGVTLTAGTLTDCIVSGNTNLVDSGIGSPAGGVSCTGGSVVRCTIVNNSAVSFPTEAAGGITVGVGGIVRDCLISGNGNDQSLPGGVWCEPGSLMEDCIITNNAAGSAGGGIYSSGGHVRKCRIVGNRSTGSPGAGAGGGVFLAEGVIENCLVFGNRVLAAGGRGGGVYLTGGTARSCTVVSNLCTEVLGVASTSNPPFPPGKGGGVYVRGGAVLNSIVYFNDASVSPNWASEMAPSAGLSYCCTIPDPGGVGNSTSDPQFANPGLASFRLRPGSGCIDAGLNEDWMLGATDLDGKDRILSSTVDIGAYEYGALTHYVDASNASPVPPYTSPSTAARDIQAALDVATYGDTILVASGVYLLATPVRLGKAIQLRSNAVDEAAVLDGNNATNCLEMTDPEAIADGFTVRNGRGSLSAPGGGVTLYAGLLTNCIVTGNFYGGYTLDRLPAAGVACYGGVVTHCSITGNTSYGAVPSQVAGGAMVDRGGLMTDCVIEDNRAIESNAGGVWCNGVVERCVINNNSAEWWGGGIYCGGGTVRNSLITGNLALGLRYPGFGGGVYLSDGMLENCLIAGNVSRAGGDNDRRGGRGGGVGLAGGVVHSCTIANNSCTDIPWEPNPWGIPPYPPGQGGGIYLSGGSATNCIIYFNTATDGPNWSSQSPELTAVSYSCLTPDPGGVGNVVLDPQFVDWASGDFHLLPSSPCLEAGLNEDWMTGAADLDGKPRLLNGTVDLGGYEYGSSYTFWAQQSFAAEDLGDPNKRASIWGYSADPNQDGRVNLQEYAFGTNPLASSNEASPMEVLNVGTDPTYLHLRFQRRLDDSTLLYVVEVSGDLQHWASDESLVREVGRTSVSGNPYLVWDEFEDLTAVDPNHSRFIRVRVTTDIPDGPPH